MLKIPFLLFVAFILTGGLQAQEPELFVEVRFLFLDESGGRYAVQQEETFQLISSYPYAISSPVTRPVGETLTVFKFSPELEREAERAREAGEQNIPPPVIKIGEIRLPNEETEILVVMRPANKGEPYKSKVYPSDSKRFPPSSIRVINLGISPIAVNVGETLEQIEPGEFKVINAQADNKHRLITRVAHRTSDDWEMMYDSVMLLKPEDRITGVVVFSPSGMKHTYTEVELAEFGDPQPRHQWLTYKNRR